MAAHNDLGKIGEQLAEAWLQKNGYAILEKNYCYGKAEIDIIALKSGLLHFVEVKCRSSFHFGHPEDHVSARKTRTILKAIDQYLHVHSKYTDFRIDILSIHKARNEAPVYFFIEDVY